MARYYSRDRLPHALSPDKHRLQSWGSFRNPWGWATTHFGGREVRLEAEDFYLPFGILRKDVHAFAYVISLD